MNINSRYGDKRKVTDNGHGVFTIEGKAEWCRFGMSEDGKSVEYFDPPGGPFMKIGEDYGFGVISCIIPESAKTGHFKVRVQVD